jgi:2-methylisocitrate lyase-like PEP mutase family enzyme
VDFEGGYSEDDSELAVNISRLIDLGVVGVNFEDRVVKGSGLYSVDRQARRLGAIRKAATQKRVDLFVNARTDVFFEHGEDAALACQSACNIDPVSASNFDPFERRVLTVALVSSELAGIAETKRARVA